MDKSGAVVHTVLLQKNIGEFEDTTCDVQRPVFKQDIPTAAPTLAPTPVPTVPTPAPTVMETAEVKFPGEYDPTRNAELKMEFERTVLELLQDTGNHSAAVRVTGIRSGSIIIEFQVTGSETSAALEAVGEEVKQSKLMIAGMKADPYYWKVGPEAREAKKTATKVAARRAEDLKYQALRAKAASEKAAAEAKVAAEKANVTNQTADEKADAEIIAAEMQTGATEIARNASELALSAGEAAGEAALVAGGSAGMAARAAGSAVKAVGGDVDAQGEAAGVTAEAAGGTADEAGIAEDTIEGEALEKEVKELKPALSDEERELQ